MQPFFTVLKVNGLTSFSPLYFEWNKKVNAYMSATTETEFYNNFDEAMDQAVEKAEFYGIDICDYHKVPYKKWAPLGYADPSPWIS